MADQLPKIHPAFSGVKKSGFAQITLEFYVAHLHIQVEHPGDCPGSDHRRHFLFTCFLESFQVAFVGFSNDFLSDGIFAGAFFLHLHAHQVAAQADAAHIVAISGIHNDHVAC